MATKKDLVEAHAFSRRRLVTAFVSGAPGGREVEPVRPGRVLIGGVALSVLLLAGAAIAGFLIGRPPAQWLAADSFIISKDTGEQYVVLTGGDDPKLRRVPNYVSAQLLLGKAELTPFTVRDKYIRTVALGEDLGIEGAPASLPEADELISDGWTACTADGAGVKVAIQEGRDVEDVTGSAFLVSTQGRRWLIAPSPDVDGEAGSVHRFRLPLADALADTLAVRLGFGPAVPEVGEEWLNLFPEGGTLDARAFGVTGSGPARYPDAVDTTTDLSRYDIGDLLESDSGTSYLLADEGPQTLTPFAAAVYGAVTGGPVTIEDDINADFADAEHPQEWPRLVPTPLFASTMCAVLHPGQGEEPTRTLAVNPGDAVAPGEIGPGKHDVDVEPSGGAYVLSSGDTATVGGMPYVIDTKGAKYALIGPAVPEYIGYGSVEPPLVPSAWLTFFREGVNLSTQSARRVPEDAPLEEDAEATE